MYNGGISDFYTLFFIESRMDVAKTSEGFSYNVCSTILPKIFTFGSFILVFGKTTIIHQQPVAMLRWNVRFVRNCYQLNYDKCSSY